MKKAVASPEPSFKKAGASVVVKAAAPSAAGLAPSRPPLKRSSTAASASFTKKTVKAKFDYSAAALEELASLQEAKASEAEGGMGKRSLAASLGDVLEESTKTKAATKEFIRKMDKNGDGSISKMEFRQSMRELGLTGGTAGYSSAEVDALYVQLDADGGGDVDLQEITQGIKDMRATAKKVAAEDAERAELASNWRGRAEKTRHALALVQAHEEAFVELKAVRAEEDGDKEREKKLVKLLAQRETEAREGVAQVKQQELEAAAKVAAKEEEAAAAAAAAEAAKVEKEAKKAAAVAAAAEEAKQFEEKINARRRKESLTDASAAAPASVDAT